MCEQKELTQTERVIYDMLAENTGSHFLDSGGAYGRHWERNQVDHPANHPEYTLTFKWNSIDFTYNVYHWLVERLEYCPDMQALFDQFCESRPDSYYLEDMEDFAAKLQGRGIYGDGDSFTVNTYNHESLLSQVLQFQYMDLDSTREFSDHNFDGVYILLQIHQGCDVRGGYTAPKAFRVTDNLGEESILFDHDASIDCSKNESHRWFTDDGYNWYSNQDNTKLNDYDIESTDESPELTRKMAVDFFNLRESELAKFKDWAKNPDAKPIQTKPVIFVDSHGNGYCPMCGGLLQ